MARELPAQSSDPDLKVTALEIDPPKLGLNHLRLVVENPTKAAMAFEVDVQTWTHLWFCGLGHSQQYRLSPASALEMGFSYEMSSSVAGHVQVSVGAIAPGVESVKPVLLRQVDQRVEGEVRGRSGVVFHRIGGESLDLYFTPGGYAQQVAPEFLEERDQAISTIREKLGLTGDARMIMAIYDDPVVKYIDTGHIGHGFATRNLAVEVVRPGARLDPYHELVHALAGELGHPPALFFEGLATFLTERLGHAALRPFGWGDLKVDDAVRAAATELWPLSTFFDFVEIGSNGTRPNIAYPQAGSLIGDLAKRYGLAKVIEAYHRLKSPTGPDVMAENRRVFLEVFRTPLEEYEEVWRQNVL